MGVLERRAKPGLSRSFLVDCGQLPARCGTLFRREWTAENTVNDVIKSITILSTKKSGYNVPIPILFPIPPLSPPHLPSPILTMYTILSYRLFPAFSSIFPSPIVLSSFSPFLYYLLPLPPFPYLPFSTPFSPPSLPPFNPLSLSMYGII